MKSIENSLPLKFDHQNPFEAEIPLYLKKRNAGDILVSVAVPDFYHIALPNLGHQMVEHQWNQVPGFFADRAYLSLEYGLLKEDPGTMSEILCISMSYEGSYIRAMRILDLFGIPPRREDRKEGDPMVIIGGWSASRNPLPLFDIADIIGIGDSEHIIRDIAESYWRRRKKGDGLYRDLAGKEGIIIPSRYSVRTENGLLTHWEAAGAPREIYVSKSSRIPHSYYLSSETDYNDVGYYDGKTFFSMEIVDACASKCAFCASGFRNRTRDFREPEYLAHLATTGLNAGADLVKLFFPANSSVEVTKKILYLMLQTGLAPRVGSAKAEYIDREYLELVGRSGQEKIAFAPETGDYMLRRHLGKPGMTNEVLENVICTSIEAGIPNLDLYIILNLPGEDQYSFQKTIDFLGSSYELAKRKGLKGRTRTCAPNFFPKAWTPFQYAASGSMEIYESRLAILQEALGDMISITSMSGDVDLLSQNIMSRGGIEVGGLLIEVYRCLKARELDAGVFIPDSVNDWRFAMEALGIEERIYFEAKPTDRLLPWHHIHVNDTIRIENIIKVWDIFRERRQSIVK